MLLQYNGNEEAMYELAQECGELRAVTRLRDVWWLGVVRQVIEFCHYNIVDNGEIIGQLKEGSDGWYVFIDIEETPVDPETLEIVRQARQKVLETL